MATHSRIFAWRILMERGAGGRAIVRGVTKSQTRLSMRKHWKNNKDSQDRVRVANKRCVASRQVTLQRLALEEQQQNPCVCEAPWGRRGRAASSHTHPHPPPSGIYLLGPPSRVNAIWLAHTPVISSLRSRVKPCFSATANSFLCSS